MRIEHVDSDNEPMIAMPEAMATEATIQGMLTVMGAMDIAGNQTLNLITVNLEL